MEISEQEAIKNLNDVSNFWFSSDCVDVNLKSLSNNLVNMSSEETQNSRAKQLKQKGRKSQCFGRPMSQQRYASVGNAKKRHSLSINQDSTFMYDFQQQNYQQMQQQQQGKALNKSINCSLSQLSGSFDPNSSTAYQINNCMQGGKVINNKTQSSNKTTEFLSSLITPGFQQSKREHYDMLIKLREKEKHSKDVHSELVLYGGSTNQDCSIQGVPKLIMSSSTSKQEELSQQIISSEQFQNTQQQQCKDSVSTHQYNHHQQQQQQSQQYSQIGQNTLRESSSNFTSLMDIQQSSNSQYQKQANISSNCFQRVLDKIVSSQKQKSNQSVSSQNSLNLNLTYNQGCNDVNQQQQQMCQQQYGYANQNTNMYSNIPHTSYKANELIENSPQFLIKLKSRFSRAASCFRKKTPIKNGIIPNNNNNAGITPSNKEAAPGSILNPKNMYTKNNCSTQEQQVAYSQSSNSQIQLLQIIPTPLSTINNRAPKGRKITISSQSEAGLQILDEQLNQLSEIDKKSTDDLSEQEQLERKNQQTIDKTSKIRNKSQSMEGQSMGQQDGEKVTINHDEHTIQQSNYKNIHHLNNSFLTYNDDDCSPITQSYRQLESNTQRQNYSGSNTRIKNPPQQYEVLKPNLYYLQSTGESKKANKIEQSLAQMNVMGHQIKKSNKQQFHSQNKENQNQGFISNRQQLSLSLYGEKSFGQNRNNENDQNMSVLQSRPLGQQHLNSLQSQNNQTIFTERQYSAAKSQQRVISSAIKGRNGNNNQTHRSTHQSNNNSYSQIAQVNGNSIHFNSNVNNNNSISNNLNSKQTNAKQHKQSTLRSSFKNENINSSQEQTNLANAHLNKYSNTQCQQPTSLKLDSKMMQMRTLAFNENSSQQQSNNNTTRIFDDQILCQKVNNLFQYQTTDLSYNNIIVDQAGSSINNSYIMNGNNSQILTVSKDPKGKSDEQQEQIEKSLQKRSQVELKNIINSKGMRNIYSGRDRQQSIDLNHIPINQNQLEQQRKYVKKKDKSDSEMIMLSAKFNQQMSRESSISNTPRYLNNNPQV